MATVASVCAAMTKKLEKIAGKEKEKAQIFRQKETDARWTADNAEVEANAADSAIRNIKELFGQK